MLNATEEGDDGRAYVEDILTSPKVAGRATFMWRGGACVYCCTFMDRYIYMYVCMCDDDDDELYMNRSVFRRISK